MSYAVEVIIWKLAARFRKDWVRSTMAGTVWWGRIPIGRVRRVL